MAETSVAAKTADEAIQELKQSDILVGIPTYNNAETIGSLLRAVRGGLAQIPSQKSVIVHADGGSTDQTVECAIDGMPKEYGDLLQISYPLYPVHRLLGSAQPIPGRDSAFRSIFSVADRLGVKACCIIDAGVHSVPQNWIGSLVQPILDSGCDLVAPQYLRHKYDGPLVNGIVYPVIRALFGKQVRQPVGSDFAYSGRFVRHCLSAASWNNDAVRQGVDLWSVLEAIEGSFKLGQAFLGARAPVRRDSPPDLSTVLSETVGAVFGQMEQRADRWQRVRGSEPVPSFGLRFDADTDHVAVDVKPLLHAYRLGCENLRDVWALILPPATLLELKKMAREPDEKFRFPDEFWARTIYDFGVGYRQRAIGRDHVLRALTPLYEGWVASYILGIREARPSEVFQRIESLCKSFEAQKPYLISRWRWPDRFMP